MSSRLTEAELGYRPRVLVRSYVGVNDHPPRLLIDPQADLASGRYRWWWHNDWITPRNDYPPDPSLPLTY